MKHLTIFSLIIVLILTGCTPKNNAQVLSPDDRSDLYESAIESARDAATNEVLPLVTEADDDMAPMMFELLGVSAQDMSAYAISVSMMNVKAYAIAAIYPAAGKEDAVLEGLRTFINNQKQAFEQYLADQHEIAVNAKLETLEDGTVLLVMSENQDEIFDAIRDVIERGK